MKLIILMCFATPVDFLPFCSKGPPDAQVQKKSISQKRYKTSVLPIPLQGFDFCSDLRRVRFFGQTGRPIFERVRRNGMTSKGFDLFCEDLQRVRTFGHMLAKTLKGFALLAKTRKGFAPPGTNLPKLNQKCEPFR